MIKKLSLTVFTSCSLLLVSGCAESPRKEGIGGGALSHVRVRLLTEPREEEESSGTATANVGEKIETFGTFKGRVVVNGNVAKLSPLVAQGQAVADAVCSLQPVENESVLVGADGGLANVFVYLSKVPNVDIPAPPSDVVQIDQKGCKFVPHASVIRVGQPLKMINSDPVPHNVKLTGVAMSLSSTIPPNDTVGLEAKYDRPERGPIPMICDFHGWMQGYQLAVNHPWAALTDENGEFEIPNAPAGKMEFVVWHEKAGRIEGKLSVEIPADGVVEKEIQVNASSLE